MYMSYKVDLSFAIDFTDAFNNEHCRLHWNYAKGGPIFQADPLEISEFTLKTLTHKKEIEDLSAAGKLILDLFSFASEWHNNIYFFKLHSCIYY